MQKDDRPSGGIAVLRIVKPRTAGQRRVSKLPVRHDSSYHAPASGQRQVVVNEADDHRSITHGRSDAIHRAYADVTGGKRSSTLIDSLERCRARLDQAARGDGRVDDVPGRFAQ